MPVIQRPNALVPGDTIAVISPSAPSDPDAMDQGVEYLESLGFYVNVMPHARQSHHYLAGNDSERLDDLHAAFTDPAIHGVIAARGGYGCMRLLPHINWALIQANPKVLIGFSDVTSLLVPMWERTGVVGFHGPMLTSNLIEGDTYSHQELWKQVMGIVEYPYTIPNRSPYRCLRRGSAEGPLLGGNLSLLAALCGTPYQPNTRGALLFIEDWREHFYSLDRQFQQLALAGLFEGIAGLILCDFVEINVISTWPN
jgi:muramoyltetrapeptide carboxypeptidase